MIWELTWPPPRLIEAGLCIVESDEEGVDSERVNSILQPGQSLSTALKGDLGCRVLEEGPFEKFPEPVALQVCQESRRHTLTPYLHLSHAYTLAGSFYFSPSRDVLYLMGVGDDEDEYCRLDELQACYGHQLNNFETVLVDETDWARVPTFLAIFHGLKTICILLTEEKDSAVKEQIHEHAELAKLSLEYPEWTPKTLEFIHKTFVPMIYPRSLTNCIDPFN